MFSPLLPPWLGVNMSCKSKFCVPHPETGELYSPREVGSAIGVSTYAIYIRIKKGDTGWRLWRPAKKIEGSTEFVERTDKECQDNLNAIPEPTKFDFLYGGK